MNKQFQLTVTMPGGSRVLYTRNLSQQRRTVVGGAEECDIRMAGAGFQFAMMPDSISWKLLPADNGTRIYVHNNGAVTEQELCVIDDLSEFSVCCSVDGALTEVARITASLDQTALISHTYDDRVILPSNGSFTVGGAGCTISVEPARVLSNVARLTRTDKGWMVDSAGDAMVFVNVTPVSKSTLLREHDFLTVGGARMYYTNGALITDSALKVNSGSLQHVQIKESAGALNYPIFIRSTRIQHQVEDDKIEIQQPSKENKPQEDNMLLRLLPSVTMLLAMVIMRAGSGGSGLSMALYMGASMGSSVLVTILTRREQKKKQAADALNRKNRYYAYLQSRIQEIIDRRQDEMRILERIYRSEEDNVNIVRNFDKGLFDRSPTDGDFLDIRLGRGTREAAIIVSTNTPEYRETDDDLVDMAQEVVDRYKNLESAPVVARLGKANSIGVVGRRRWLFEMVKTMTVDLVVRHYYKDLKLYYVLDETDVERFAWARWLQNCSVSEDTPYRTLMYDDESTKFYLEVLYRILSTRAGQAGDKDMLWPEYHVVFVYRIDRVRNHPISQYFEYAAKLGVRFIFMDEAEERIPRGCSQLIRLDNAGNTGSLIYTRAAEKVNAFEYVTIMSERMEEIVRKLAGVHVVESSLANEMVKNITLYQLLGIQSADDLDFARMWEKSDIVKSMSVPLGVRAKNAIQYLDLHEKAHGPHGLVAGTTGSGKSEILQSYLINLAVYFRPDEVNFLLIDFKGGGMSNLFEGLPHLTGAITDIDGREIQRSLKAIRAELERRKRLFERARVNKMDDYIKLRKQNPENVPEPLPHLIIVVDEFAELKAEQPDFMKELISAARVGRSLGVHLILATQKPAGVVDPQIVSNSRFRLCLKVASKEDSNEMIKTPLAAEIREPGRAYLQVGNNEIFELFQSAYSGGPEPTADASEMRPYTINELTVWGKPQPVYKVDAKKGDDENGRRRSELEAVRDSIIRFCKDVGIEPLQKVCLPPMPPLIASDTLPAPEQGLPGSVMVYAAMYDDPEEHYQGPYPMDLAQNNTFIIGAAQMGKTEALISIIHQAVFNYTPEQVNFYIIDAGNLALSVFEECPHVGALVDYRNEDLVENTMKFLRGMMQARRDRMLADGVGTYLGYCATGKTDMPLAVLVIDNVAAFREYYDQYDEMLQALAREGMSAGITLLFTGNAMGNLHYRIQASFTMKICMTVNDPTEYMAISGVRGMEPHNQPGSCLVPLEKRAVEAQFSLPLHIEMDEDAERALGTEEEVAALRNLLSEDDKRRSIALRKALRKRSEEVSGQAAQVPVVPKELILSEEIRRDPGRFRIPYQVVLGMEYTEVEYVSIGLDTIPALLISGASRQDLTVPMQNILTQLQNNIILQPTEVYIADGMRRYLSDARDMGCVKEYTLEMGRIREMVDEICGLIEERQQQLFSLEDESMAEELKKKWPLELLVFADEKGIDQVAGDKKMSEKLVEALESAADCKVCFVFARYPNQKPSYSDELGKRIAAEGTLIFTDRIANLRVVDASGVLRTMNRTFAPMDAYLHHAGNFVQFRQMLPQ